MSRAGAGLVEETAGLCFDGGGIVSLDDAPWKEMEGLWSLTAASIIPTASSVETIDAPARLEAGLIEVTAGLVEIEAGLTKVIAAPVRAPSKVGLVSFDL